MWSMRGMTEKVLMDISILVWVAVAIGAYMLLIRPGQKRAKEQAAQVKAITEGTRVMLASGIYGTVKHLGERQAVVEVSPGVELTVIRGALSKPVRPEDEDFEYADVDDNVAVGDVGADYTDAHVLDEHAFDQHAFDEHAFDQHAFDQPDDAAWENPDSYGDTDTSTHPAPDAPAGAPSFEAPDDADDTRTDPPVNPTR